MTKLIKLIEKLISKTENKEIQWSLIDDNEYNISSGKLKNLVLHYEDVASIIRNYSFKGSFQNGEIYLISLTFEGVYVNDASRFDVEHLVLVLKTPKAPEPLPLNGLREEQSNLFRLFNMVERQISDVEDYIDTILDDFNF